jgi:hypothetical protein
MATLHSFHISNAPRRLWSLLLSWVHSTCFLFLFLLSLLSCPFSFSSSSSSSSPSFSFLSLFLSSPSPSPSSSSFSHPSYFPSPAERLLHMCFGLGSFTLVTCFLVLEWTLLFFLSLVVVVDFNQEEIKEEEGERGSRRGGRSIF